METAGRRDALAAGEDAQRNRKVVEKPAAETPYGEAGAVKEECGEPPGEPVIRPIAVPAKAEEAEQRVRVRAKVNFFACVRTEEFKGDIAACIDMSPGRSELPKQERVHDGDENIDCRPVFCGGEEGTGDFRQGKDRERESDGRPGNVEMRGRVSKVKGYSSQSSVSGREHGNRKIENRKREE